MNKERAKLFEENIYIAERLANKLYQQYYYHCKAQFVELDDIYQLALIGLMKAVERFDESMGNKFITYAYPNVEGEIRRYMRDKANIIRVPRNSNDEYINNIRYRNVISSTDTILMANEKDQYTKTLEDILFTEDKPCEYTDLYNALDTLKGKERICIIEYFFNDKKQNEIGKEIGLSQMQISRYISKGLSILRNSKYLREVI